MTQIGAALTTPTKWTDGGPYGKFQVYANGDCISETINGGQFWDGGVILPFLDRWADPTKLAIEIGSFCGQGAVYLSKKCKSVMAVEPVHHRLVENSIRANGVTNVRVLPFAAYSFVTRMGIPEAEALPGLANPGGQALVPIPYGPIPAIPLDPEIGDTPVCLIQSDAQGCDLRALVGLVRTIERDRPPILFEFESTLARYHGDDWSHYLDFFAPLGYNLTEQTHLGYPNNWVALPLEATFDKQ